MKKFLIIVNVFLLAAVLAIIGIFWYIHSLIDNTPLEGIPVVPKEETSVLEGDVGGAAGEGIPLNEAALTPEQKDVLEKAGVDTESFVITPAMARCAEEKLGEDRMKEIAAGDLPSLIESGKLLPCLGAE